MGADDIICASSLDKGPLFDSSEFLPFFFFLLFSGLAGLLPSDAGLLPSDADLSCLSESLTADE